MSMDEHYRRWTEADCVRRFAEKGVGEFFETERRFLTRIMPGVSSVLDVGCASGRLLELLRQYRPNLEFDGIDIVADSIDRAKRLYPESRFWCGNALGIDPGRRYDLVNATGVCQHEPRFEDLIRRMWDWSESHLLFDVKLGRLDSHLIDIDRSYSGETQRLYFIIASLPALLETLKALPGVGRIEAYGYVTKPNRHTTVPAGLGDFASAGFLLDRTPNPIPPEISLELPAFLTA